MKRLPITTSGYLAHTALSLAGCGLALTLLQTSLPAQIANSALAGQAGATQQKPDKPDKTAEQKTEQKSETTQGGVISDQPGSVAPDLPLLLLVVQRPAGTPARKDDVNSQLSLTLRSTLRDSRRYQVILFSAEHPSIRRALLEHAIAASELVEPIKSASLEKLAGILGAHHVLMVSGVLDKVGLKTDIRLLQDAGGDAWITPRSEPVIINAQFGKLRLKTDQMVALTVDTIDNYLGIPSHLADSIRISGVKMGTRLVDNSKPKSITPTRPDETPDNGDDKEGVKADINGNTGEEPGKEVKAEPKKTADPKGTKTPDNKTDKNTDKNTDKKTNTKAITKADAKSDKKNNKGPDVKNDKTLVARATPAPAPNGDSTGPTNATPINNNNISNNISSNINGNAGNNGTETSAQGSPNTLRPTSQNTRTTGRGNASNILTTDTGAMLLTEPRIVPPVPPTDKPNLEAVADRYRRTGDLSNHIQYIRQAIDENPKDLRLRKKLIAAYQERQLLDLAISETERALVLQPNDGDLTRLYANCLVAKGDVSGAIKLLRDIVATNPRDTAAQVALGDALLTDSQFLDAYHAFEAAATNDPKSPLPHRRMARVLAIRASSDPMLYTECLRQVEEARKLTPITDTQTYQGDYFDIMLLLESRLKDLLDQANGTVIGVNKRPKPELERTASDLNDRADVASNFLDSLPPATGQDTMHAHYAQAAALVVQAIGYLRKYLKTNDPQFEGSLRSTRLDALSEISKAHARLLAARADLEKGRAAIGEAVRGN